MAKVWRGWTAEEIEFVTKNLKTMQLAEIAEKLGRSKASIQSKIGISGWQESAPKQHQAVKIQVFKTHRVITHISM